MRSMKLVFAMSAVLGPVTPAVAQAPSDSIDWAIERGLKAKKCDLLHKHASPKGGGAGHYVLVMGPLNSIECAAASAANAYRGFTRKNLDEDDLLTEVLVITSPNGAGGYLPPDPTNLILRLRTTTGDSIVHPDSMTTEAKNYQNGYGGTFTALTLTAHFAPKRWPNNDFEFVVTTSVKEYTAKVSSSDRRKVR